MQLVKNINPQIFRGYDIRGVVDTDLSEAVYYTLGRAYATWLSIRRIKEVPVGRDNRLTSESYAQAFMLGLNHGGVDTIDLGLSLSQIVYFSAYEFKTKGNAMITASHNPKNYNGMKLGTGYSETMVTAEIQSLRAIVTSGNYVTGEGKHRSQDINQSYQQTILKYFNLKKPWRVVVDACNTTSGMFYPAIFKAAGCIVIEQNCQLDGNFPLGVPDPTEVEVLNRLSVGVKTNQADIGFAFDADGDRLAVVDENGSVLWMDTIVAIFAKDVLDFMPGAKIIYNTLCSRQVTDAITSSGGQALIELTGHSFIKARVKKEQAPFGGELSGHIFFMDNFFGHDDAAYASLRLLAYLERKNQTLSQAVAELNHYVSSPEIKFGLPDDIKFKFIDTVLKPEFQHQWPDAEYTLIEGVRMDYTDKMAILRASQNGPYITIKFEAKTQKDYDLLKHQLKALLSAHPEINWETGVNTHALD